MTVPRTATKKTSGGGAEDARFVGKTVVVTGAARGIGRSVAELLVEEGARVVAVDKRASDLKSAFATVRSAVDIVAADLAEPNAASLVVSQAVSRFGGVDVLINNAGVTTRAPLEQTSDAIWEEMIGVNLRSAFLLCRAAAPVLKRREGGAIVNVASINAIRGNLQLSAYSAAKGGLVSLTRALATEFAEHGIRVNAVCPGTIDTPMTDEYLAGEANPSETLAAVTQKHPLGRLGTPDDVANVIVFLASDEAAFVTGVVVPVDGGRHLL